MDAVDDMLLDLLTDDLPCGQFLVEDQGEVRMLWRISEGEPVDSALDPARGWWLLVA